MNTRSIFPLCLKILIVYSLSACLPCFAVPKVVASIPPFYALVAGVMEGVGEPYLLLKPGASPHHYALRPSEMSALSAADIIFWGGPGLETFLIKPLASLPQPKQIIEFDKSKDLTLLPIRANALFAEDAHHHDHNHDHHHKHEGIYDMHFWLDPTNAIAMVDSIQRTLSDADPKHNSNYQKNAEHLKKELLALDAKLKSELAPIKQVPFIVFHDAYQYFEHRYGLRGVGAIALHPELPPSIARIKQIHDVVKNAKVHCVFSEPQFKPSLVDSIVQDTGVKTGVLDPLGPKSSKGADGYFTLMQNLSRSLIACLSLRSQ